MKVRQCRLSWALPGQAWTTLDYLLIPSQETGESQATYWARCVSYLMVALHLPVGATMVVSQVSS
jgi:hypothetical protein